MGLFIAACILVFSWVLIKILSNEEFTDNDYIDENRRKVLSSRMNKISNFTPTIKYEFNHCIFAFDENRKLLFFISENEEPRLIPFSKILDVKLFANDQVLSRNVKPNIKGAVAGGILFGAAGAVVGSMRYNIDETKCKSVSIKVGFKEINEKPIHESLYAVIAVGNSVIKMGSIEQAEEIENIFATIIEMNKK